MENQDFNPEQIYHQAIAAYQAQQFDVAENLLRQVLAVMPTNIGIISTLGGVLLGAGKPTESIALLQQGLALDPNSVEVQLNLAVAYQQIGKRQEALNLFATLAAAAPNREDVQTNYANILLQTGQYEQAIPVLLKMLEINPQLIRTYDTLAQIYTYLQRTEEAVAVYQKVLHLVPNDLSTLVRLGNLYADNGRTQEALTTYLQATAIHPNEAIPFMVLGKFYLDIGKHEEGEQALLKAFEIAPQDLNTAILLGNVCNSTGRIEQAETYYRRALEIDPNSKGALRNLRRIYSRKIPYWHFEMLADVERNDAYQKAIEKVVTKNSTVLDIGTGSGLLSMMAARAGAKNVTACEMHPYLAATAKEIVKANGYEEQITVFPKKSTELKVGKEVAEKVDIIISEILDAGALGEGVLPSIRHAALNLAQPNAILIPAKVQLYGQLIEIPSRSMVAPVRTISGFDLSIFEQYRIPDEYTKINLKAEKYKVLSPVIPLLDIDFYHLPPAYMDEQPFQKSLTIPITANGEGQAMVFWFDLYLDDEIMVSSCLDGALEHWGQALFCFPNTKVVKKGEKQRVILKQSDQLIQFEW